MPPGLFLDSETERERERERERQTDRDRENTACIRTCERNRSTFSCCPGSIAPAPVPFVWRFRRSRDGPPPIKR